MSDLKDEIKKAIGTHGLWKARLLKAIDTGSFDATPEQVSVDNRCEFGKWLHGPALAADVKTSTHCREVVGLHAQFHKVASKVVSAAVKGEKAVALDLVQGDYAKASSALTGAMMRWRAG